MRLGAASCLLLGCGRLAAGEGRSAGPWGRVRVWVASHTRVECVRSAGSGALPRGSALLTAGLGLAEPARGTREGRAEARGCA